MGSRLATWALSGVQHDTWRVHSSLALPDDQKISAIDCKSGLLAVGTLRSLSVYTLILENDLPTWSLKWMLPIAKLTRVRFAPSLMYIASTSSDDNNVRIYLTTSGKQLQSIPHPRLVTDVNWRMSQASSREASILYTVTADATLRVFLPVLDAPQQLQLHASLDIFSALPFSIAAKSPNSSIYWLDRAVMSNALTAVLDQPGADKEEAGRRRIQEVRDEGWDLFLRVLSDGSLVLQAVANIDRRPPTLLKHFTLLQSPPGTLKSTPLHLYVLPHATVPSLLTLITSPPITTSLLRPLLFFDARADGLEQIASGEELPHADELKIGVEQRKIIRFERTPDGEGVGAIRMEGAGETWTVSRMGRHLTSRGRWKLDEAGNNIDHLVVLDRGKQFVTYSSATQKLVLHTHPPAEVELPNLAAIFSLPRQSSMPSSRSITLVALTTEQKVILVDAILPSQTNPTSSPSLRISSYTSLPLDTPPALIMPVDPMAWSGPYLAGTWAMEHDVLLSVTSDGELAFWIPTEASEEARWKCTGTVRTGRRGLSIARCSSAKKSALVVLSPEGQELTIWDSKESEFASGLEYRQLFSSSDPISDLDWTATPDNQSILTIGFTHRVEVLSQQRLSYFDDIPAWGLCRKIDIENIIPHPISDSIWLNRGSLLIGAGHLLCLYGQPKPAPEDPEPPESLFEYVALHNGPLSDYHPQLILQCLLWDKVEVVKSVIVNLAHNIARRRNIHEWHFVPFEEFLKKEEVVKASHLQRPAYPLLFSGPEPEPEKCEEEEFSTTLVQQLLERLEEKPSSRLTPNEHESLVVLIQTVLEIDEQRRALDANGVRYLITMRVFYILNRRLSAPSTPASNNSVPIGSRKRERLRYRDMMWAFHSESQDLLLSASIAACDGGKMYWSDAKALGIFIWLQSAETMKAHMEVIARNEFLAGDNRDPTKCSLFYFALGKVKLVHGLWRQASWHKEQGVMLKFLHNDFSQPRWRTAALKNAYALLSKRRFEYSAAFFLLGGSLKDAVNVCIKNLQDFQLAVAIARVVEQDDNGPVLAGILNNTVIPTAFREGNRWLASWAFWLLRRRDLAVRILITPLQAMTKFLVQPITEIGEPHFDDPSLALLFSQLKSKTLQTAKGTSEISGRTEFNFVLQMARVFCRMGCHVLALDLVRSWSFHRPSVVTRDVWPPPSPVNTRLALEPALRRRASIVIDMDIESEPPTRRASPVGRPVNGIPVIPEEVVTDEGDLIARKAGIGSLMKSAKENSNVPDFDMSAFF
ncbi:unnamed protein product [Somion occarium]